MRAAIPSLLIALASCSSPQAEKPPLADPRVQSSESEYPPGIYHLIPMPEQHLELARRLEEGELLTQQDVVEAFNN